MDDIKKFHTVRGYELIQQNKKLLTSAMEDYLEMIYRTCISQGYMRINTLSELLNVQASSATKMVQRLSKLGIVSYQKYGIIFLTQTGKEIGKFLLERHKTLETFLQYLGVKDNLLIETELIEHSVSSNTLQRFEMLNNFFEAYPELLSKFEEYCSSKFSNPEPEEKN
ncbi:MAG: DtxR family transcriptional regulator [Clostridia bacterium]|nr:DtxR family transcriptional regulator [Clostridia bacterium]